MKDQYLVLDQIPQSADFNFEAEVKCLPFKLNLGDEAKLTCIQHSWFIDLIYDHPEVFSLHDEDLGFLQPDQTYYTNNNGQACVFSTLHHSSTATRGSA